MGEGTPQVNPKHNPKFEGSQLQGCGPFAFHPTHEEKEREMSPNESATPKQLEYIKSLLVSRTVDQHWIEKASKEADAGMDRDHASKWIDWLTSQPKRERPSLNVAPGVYTDGNLVYQVKVSKTSNRPWARIAKPKSGGGFDFLYDPNAIEVVANTCHPMDVAAVAALGLAQHWCVVCGKQLTDSQSVADGIGPVCKKNQSDLVANHK